VNPPAAVPAIPDSLRALVQQEALTPVDGAIAAVVDKVRQRHGDGVAAVLAYGSCLRDGVIDGRVVDLYVLTDSYATSGQRRVLRWLSAILPPNVYYTEQVADGRRVRCKYAVVSLPHLERLVTAKTFHPYFWARFAQPTTIAWRRDEAAGDRTVALLATAVQTLAGEAAPLLPTADVSSAELWVRAFAETYRTELRSERADRPAQIYSANAERYDRLFRLLRDQGFPSAALGGPARTLGRWRRRRLLGRALSVLRLIKAGFTFEGAADYLKFKIEQHAGIEIALTPWQQRHPILGAVLSFWKLYRTGAIR
jgi:hypothetical protein